MNEHGPVNDLLLMYAAGGLEDGERRLVESHLAGCELCQADLALWQAAGAEINSAARAVEMPPRLADRALARIRVTPRRAPRRVLRWMVDLLRYQAILVRSEIWPASTAIIALGCIAVWLGSSPEIIRMLAPLIAAACLAAIYGPANDPGVELALSTPTPPGQILLARVALVFSFNLALGIAAGLVIYPLAPVGGLGALILSWLAPMSFLSAAALALSIWIGTSNAVTAAFFFWLVQYAAGDVSRIPALSPSFQNLLVGYRAFWANPGLLLSLALLLGLLAVWKVGRRDLRLPDWA